MLARDTGYPAGTLWSVPETYNMVSEVCDRHPRDQVAMIWEQPRGSTTVSWGELQDDANRLARALKAKKVGRGDRVAILSPQSPITAAAMLGILKVGAVILPLPSGLADRQIAFRLEDAEAAVVVTDRLNRDRVPSAFTCLVLDADQFDHFSTRLVTEEMSSDDSAFLLYTSGTTQEPKGVLFAHRTMLADSEFDYCQDLRKGELTYWTGEWAWTLKKVFGPWRRGAVNVAYSYEGRLDLEAMLRVLQHRHVTNVFLNATVIKMMMQEGDLGRRFPQAFRVATTSNEALGLDAFHWFEEQFGVPPLEFYGLTESYPMVGNSPDVPVKPGSMGRPVPGWDVCLLEEERDVPAELGAEGEIALLAASNPHWPVGYWNRPEETDRDFGRTWYRTKDLAHRDEDGYFWFHARRDDLIKASGYRISPVEVEQILTQHGSVREAAVVGLPDAVRGATVKAFVALVEGVLPSRDLEEELIAYVRKSHSSFAAPRAIEFVSDFPRSGTGKIRRSVLRGDAADVNVRTT